VIKTAIKTRTRMRWEIRGAHLSHRANGCRGALVTNNLHGAIDTGQYHGVSGPGGSSYGQVTGMQARSEAFSDGLPGRGGEIQNQLANKCGIGSRS